MMNLAVFYNSQAKCNEKPGYIDNGKHDDGKIAEHWDVMEAIVPESEWKHQNGRYGFPRINM